MLYLCKIILPEIIYFYFNGFRQAAFLKSWLLSSLKPLEVQGHQHSKIDEQQNYWHHISQSHTYQTMAFVQ